MAFAGAQLERLEAVVLVLGAANQPNWERTCKAMGREDLMERDEYKTDKDRAINYLKLAEEL